MSIFARTSFSVSLHALPPPTGSLGGWGYQLSPGVDAQRSGPGRALEIQGNPGYQCNTSTTVDFVDLLVLVCIVFPLLQQSNGKKIQLMKGLTLEHLKRTTACVGLR